MLALRMLLAMLVLPGLSVILIPAALVRLTRSMHVGWGLASPWHVFPVVLGGLLIVFGLTFGAWTSALFLKFGCGTPAPWDPPRQLVIRGPYRHVRNPMIASVFFMLLGEAALFGSWVILGWFCVFLAANLVYIPAVEEPRLARRFGEDYLRYRRNVPRWIPRRTARASGA